MLSSHSLHNQANSGEPVAQPPSNMQPSNAPNNIEAGIEPAAMPDSEARVLAQAIDRAGMAGFAAFMLGVLKPLHWVGAQALWAFQPFVDALGLGSRRATGNYGALSAGGLARLLEKESGVDELAAQLEGIQRERKESA